MERRIANIRAWVEEPRLKEYERVRVSAEATGTGESPTGWVSHIERFMGREIVSVMYDRATADGRSGITLTNTGMITRLK